MTRCAVSLLLVLLAAACGETYQVADAVYVGGVVHTLDPDSPRVEAVAVEGDRILATGTSKDIRARHAGPGTRLIDLGGACVVPGLIDAHGHLASLGHLKHSLDLRDTRSLEEMLERVASRAAGSPPGTWVEGRGWDQADWGEKELPAHERLSEVTPGHPVLLVRVDGHAALANRRALDLAGITRDTRDPAGGEILRDGAGEPTGMLIDTAIDLVSRVVPEGGGAPIEDLWRAAEKACFEAGLTGVHDAGVSRGSVGRLRALFDSGELRLRVHAMLSAGVGIVEHLQENRPVPDTRFAVRAVKLFVDGAMGSRGAWLLEDYVDRPGHRGLAVSDPARIRSVAAAAFANGWQVCTHAIGDRGNREVLDAYEAAISDPGADHRFRVEHAQCLSLVDIPRFARLGVIASMQPTHATTDMRWAEDRVGRERLAGCYAWRRLLDSGTRLAFGSDFPVESERPLWGIYAAVTRQDHDGRPAGGWLPDQRLTPEEALRAFTLDAAHAAFWEEDLGSLEPGKLADLTVLDRDVLTVPPGEILETRVLLTVVGGEIVYRAEAGSPRETVVR
jgi:predicted amidohydrolase YtcJ